MPRPSLPVESKRVTKTLRCAPVTWHALDQLADMSGMPVGRVVDRLIERQTKKETK